MEISIHQLREILEKGLPEGSILVDVRMPSEYNQAHIKGALNIPLNELEERKGELSKYGTIYLHCHSGGRSEKGCDILKKTHPGKVINVRGGIHEWQTEDSSLLE